MGEDLSDDMPESSESEPVPGKIGDTEIWWLPFVALGFFPFIFSIIWIDYVWHDQPPWFLDFWEFVVYPVVSISLGLSPILVVVYVVYLVRITRKRIENGTTNLALSLFHLLTLIVPFLGFGLFLLFAGASGA